MTVHAHSEYAAAVSSVKIVISGGFGVGKTTFIRAISEIEPLTTEAAMTELSVGVDDPGRRVDKAKTTVALDFGRITLDKSLVLYLFGTPGQARFRFLWDDLSVGSLGAIVVVDVGRLADSFPVLDYFEHRADPFIVAINDFEDEPRFSDADIRRALGIDDSVPLVACDARNRGSVRATLVTLVEHVLACRLATTR